MACAIRPLHILLLALTFACACQAAGVEPKTVCTITVNSPDEKEALRQRLPKDQYRFVELVAKGRSDWLGSACEKAIECDVLVISGHFNAGDVFYSDKAAVNDYLRVDELERASCSNSCPALFSRLKEVYLFGCESLNPDASKYSSSYGESGLARMRRIFANVPVIYGFSSSAPVGATAAMLLNRHFDAAPSSFGSGRTSARLLSVFSRNHMTATRGVRDSGGAADDRRQICQFFDERLTPARKLSFVHAMMRRDMGEALATFERIDRMLDSLTAVERQTPQFVEALAVISADDGSRERYLAAERATREAPRRSRMIALAGNLGWLSPEDHQRELARLVSDVLASSSIGFADVDLACSLGDTVEISQPKMPPSRASRTAVSAVLACLGDKQARARILAALWSTDERDVQVAQAYLRHRPVSDMTELRWMVAEIARMTNVRAQVRALDTLGRLHIIDSEVLEGLARTFAAATSLDVQRAIAEVFLRSGPRAIARSDLAGVLREHRIKSLDGEDLVDVLIRRLEAPA